LLKLGLNGRKQFFYLFIYVCIHVTEGDALDIEQQTGRTYDNC